MASQQEQVFLETSEILITNARIRLQGGKTFATANVTSVSTQIVEYPQPPEPSKKGPIIMIIIGALIGLSSLGNFGSNAGGAFFGLLIGAGLVFGGIQWYKSLKAPERERPDYLLMIGSASGELEGMRSKDQALIARVAEAINQAMIARG
ncbi:MAG TPA: DUF6232 family protein [Armatimonadota bacterium]|nr:DUF6232 family protein [Armatimonadota bacterium]